jgi:hypothetical protein
MGWDFELMVGENGFCVSERGVVQDQVLNHEECIGAITFYVGFNNP